jgi:uncharacterized heparinase superfamily protein
LRPTQIFGRLFNHLRVVRSVSTEASAQRPVTGKWVLPACREASFSNDGQPRFLNLSGELKTPADWNATDAPRLWLYNLHYFDDLNARGAEKRRSLHCELIQRWVDENPPFAGTGWEPYPCSLRIVNWIKWSLAGNELKAGLRQSLALQVAWLEKNIEWHLLGNHLFANAKALVFAGLYFDGRDAERWLEKGITILAREVSEQIFDDGGHFELSPMYHSIATEDMLDLINMSQAYADQVPEAQIREWESVAKNMLDWAAVMQHPNGKIVLFNDSTFGIAPDLGEIFSYAERIGIHQQTRYETLVILPDTGYMRASNVSACLFADMAAIGPDYLPGHAHADSLNFELSLFGERWIVDSGCSTYEVSDERLRQRGTSAHNTVTVDGEDSSEVWSSFRVARRARPVDVAASCEGDQIRISGGHDGYRRLKGRVMHYREFHLNDVSLQISDELSGDPRSAVANFLLHPDVSVSQSEGGFELSRGSQNATLGFNTGDAEVIAATYHPEFGLSVPTQRISVTMPGKSLITTLKWTLNA